MRAVQNLPPSFKTKTRVCSCAAVACCRALLRPDATGSMRHRCMGGSLTYLKASSAVIQRLRFRGGKIDRYTSTGPSRKRKAGRICSSESAPELGAPRRLDLSSPSENWARWTGESSPQEMGMSGQALPPRKILILVFAAAFSRLSWPPPLPEEYRAAKAPTRPHSDLGASSARSGDLARGCPRSSRC